MTTPYEILGVREDASQKVVEAAYRALVKIHHPDQGGSSEDFQKIKAAYKTIKENNTTDSQPRGTDSQSSSPDKDEQKGFKNGENTLGGISTSESSESKEEGPVEEGITVNGKYTTATIQALIEIDVSDGTVLQSTDAWGRVSDITSKEPFNESEPYRYFVLFDVENTSNQLLAWRTQNAKFMGTDGYTYNKSDLTLNKDILNPRVSRTDSEIEPGRKAKIATLVENTPEGVQIDEIVNTLKVYKKGKTQGFVQEEERYVFKIEPEDEEALLSLPTETGNITD